MLSNKDTSLIKTFFSDKPVKRAFLFGSFSRNEAVELSDIDILIELDYSQQIGLNYFSMENELSKLLQRKVDFLSANALTSYLQQRIEKDKILIYERTAA